jgi:hypothetical protein
MSWPRSPLARVTFWWYNNILPRWIELTSAHRLRQPETFVMFLAHANTGHSLIGQLLNAHPDVVISHELHALKLVHEGITRKALFARIVARARYFRRIGSKWYGYDYTIPGAHQGRIRDLKVIGDKMGGRSARMLEQYPNVLRQTREVVGIPLRFIHVYRNPFDSIATNAIKQHPGLKNDLNHISRSAENYLSILPTIHAVTTAEDTFRLQLERFIADPRPTLVALATWLGIEPLEDWVQRCGDAVFTLPRKTRQQVRWSSELRQRVEQDIARYPWLAAYRFED